MNQTAHFETLSVDLQVGGKCARCAPMCTGVFDGRGLSLFEIHLAVEKIHAFRLAGARPLSARLELVAGPELFEHPQPVAVWTFLRQAEVGTEAVQDTEYGRLCTTDGWRLGTDPEAEHLLSEFRDAGLRHVWFSVCGLEETHDATTGRSGAFAAIVTAMERCREVGLETGASILLSKRNVAEVRELALLMRSLGAERFMQLYPLPGQGSGPVAEDSQLQPEDVTGLPPRDLDIEWGQPDIWVDPEAATEGALTKAALAGEGRPSTSIRHKVLWLRVTADLKLVAPEAIERGNSIPVADLREDSPAGIHALLLDLPWPPELPSDKELARLYGDTTSRILSRKWFLRRKWLDAWRTDHSFEWVPLDLYE